MTSYYLKNISDERNKMDVFNAYEFSGNPINIERFIILGYEPCETDKYNIFDLSLSDFAKRKAAIASQNANESFATYDKSIKGSYDPFLNSVGKKVYLYVKIISTKEHKAVLCTQSYANSKLWFNGKCISINQSTRYSYISLDFAKGVNIIIIEKLNPTKLSISSILIDNYYEQDVNSVQSANNLKGYITIDPPVVISSPKLCTESSKYRFMLFRNQKAKQKYRIKITDSDGKEVGSTTSVINEVVEIDLESLRSAPSAGLKCYEIICYIKSKNNKSNIKWCIYLNDFVDTAKQLNVELLKKLEAIHSKSVESDITKLKKIIKNPSLNEYYNYFWTAYNYDKFKASGQCFIDAYIAYERPRIREIYIRSCLDDSRIRIGQNLPKNYQKEKKYPVIIALSPSNEGWFCWMMKNNILKEECLIFDVTVRGVTGGSYAGESSFLEIFEWIKANYNIDEDRVYLLGYSNGGYATWAIAQNHPHIAAAIYPLCATPQFKNIENVSNVPVFQLISPKDSVYDGKDKLIRRSLGKYGNYFETLFKQHAHIDFQYHVINSTVLNNLLQFKRNKYPNRVVFSTCRNRHLKSFWVELHGISRGHKYARIEAIIQASNAIVVTIKGTDGFTIEIPPQIDKKCFDLIINGQKIKFEGVTRETIMVCKKRKWMQTDAVPYPNYRKGTGLLDVYLGKANIILPSRCSSSLQNTANVFSHPCTYGYDPNIYISYNVYADDNPPENVFDDNLIILESDASCNIYTKILDSLLLVKYDNNSYTYKEEKTYGDYLIMQIIKNPFDEKKSILIVSTNNESLLSRNFFTRNMKIPYYMNGLHPYLNNVALIYNGKDYFGIYEEEGNIKKISE